MPRQGSWERRTWEDLNSVFSSERGSIRVVHDVESPFGEFLVVQRTPIIELNSSYGTSALRDIETATGSGSITTSNAEIIVSTGATATSTAKLETSEVGRYIPGYAAEIGVGIRIPTDPTGNQVFTWGGLSSGGNDGLYFGKDATGFFVARLRSGSETKVYQSSWNKDILDGTGDSTFNINNADGHIYQINFTWYGYGSIEFGVVGTVNGIQRFIPCHVFSDFNETSIVSPNLRVFAEADNGGDASDATLYVAGRQYSIIGQYVPKFRFTGDWRAGVTTGTTEEPIVSFRRKTGFEDRSVKLEGFDVLSATQPHIIEIRIGGSLTGASFGTPTNHTAAETALESDTSATAITGGIVVWQELVDAGAGAQVELAGRSVDFDIPDTEVVTICARTVSGSGSVSAALRMREEW